MESPENKLVRLDEPASLMISDVSLMPVLDGAEAAYPVYSAFTLRDILIIVVISYPAAEYRKIYRKYGNIFRLEFIPLYAPFLCGGTLAQHKVCPLYCCLLSAYFPNCLKSLLGG